MINSLGLSIGGSRLSGRVWVFSSITNVYIAWIIIKNSLSIPLCQSGKYALYIVYSLLILTPSCQYSFLSPLP